MTIGNRMKITLVAAGAAGAAAFTVGGMAFAGTGDDGARTELRIVEEARSGHGGAVPAAYAAPGDETFGAGKDCPEKRDGGGTSPAVAADPR